MRALCIIFAFAATNVLQRPSAFASPSGAATDFFESRVRPVLFTNCTKCHGPTQQQGGLRLDSREALLKGGGRGPAMIPGNAEGSLLLQAITHSHATLRMPPTGKLSDAEIGALTLWIRTSAAWPEPAPAKSAADSKELWSVRPLRNPGIPRVRNPGWVANPIDAFILQHLEREGRQPAPPADRRTLIRRAYFDLLGLPPSPEEVAAFTADASPRAYEQLINRLLNSPHYGERWARYWLDLVRYADSNGYERDAEKKYSWKYRDYVIKSLNDDKPYSRFVMEQIAGDELPDRNEESVTGTGFLRLGTWDDEPNDPLQYKYERLDDLVHATGTAFLALTVKCARCHDHKFDPIPQKEYYAFAAAFWGGHTTGPMGGPPDHYVPYPVLGFTDAGRESPPLHLLQNGDPRREGPVIEPGYLSLLRLDRKHGTPWVSPRTTMRRLHLAEWIVDWRNPLTPRVLVNRLWQHHFGEGLVRTPNNFGSKGAEPTHPELLDWLASDFVAHGSTLKRMHRQIMLSSAYRMASLHPQGPEYQQKDYANESWWHFNRRRLDADAICDAILCVSGQLNRKSGGPGFFPALTPEALEGLSRKGDAWTPSTIDEQNRRSVYMFLKRSLLPPMMTVFDFSDTTQPVEQRDVTIVAPQALTLLNNPFVHQQSKAFARRVAGEVGADSEQQIARAWQLALGRNPTVSERSEALSYVLNRKSSADSPGLNAICHVLFNSNEFMYVD